VEFAARKGSIMVRMFVFTTAVLLTAGTLVLAQERAACHPDVIKYCKELVRDNEQSDVFAILGCLQTNRTRISVACQQVLAGHGQ
jgi:hypothetical protein